MHIMTLLRELKIHKKSVIAAKAAISLFLRRSSLQGAQRRIHPEWTTLRLWIAASLTLLAMTGMAYAATSIPFTINTSEAVNVTGTPRIAVDVGGTTRYATYTSGSGTNALTFTYSMVAGDADLDGVALSSPIDLNGGTIKDLNGNDAALTFTVPNTSNVKVNYPSLGMDFVADADGRYTLNGTVYNDLSSFLTAAGGTFTRASTATYFDSTGTLQTASSGTPRFDYDPITHAAKGILIEESRTNYAPYSQNISSWSYTPADISVATGAGVFGLPTYVVSDISTAVRNAVSRSFSLSVNVTYTVSLLIKKDATNNTSDPLLRLAYNDATYCGVFFNPATGTVTNYNAPTATTSENYGSFWRVSFSCLKSTAYPTALQLFPAHGSSANLLGSIEITAIQLEQGAFPTSYITTTTTAAVTRSADLLTVPTGAWLDSSKGTLFAQASMPFMGAPRWPALAALDDGTANNMIHLYVSDNTGDAKSSQIVTGGSILFYSTAGAAYTAGTTLKSSVSYATNDARLSADGVFGTADNSLTIPSITTLRIGSNAGGSAINFTDGTIQKFKYYPSRITDTQLQLMTQ